jgi:flavin-dependent dehydrogenase
MISVNKIVIVGGGSAGWMSAATMIRKFPQKEIIVIESPDYPIIGVGESTLGGLLPWANWIGIDEKDFMPATEATYKMSIRFTDFYKEDSGSFHYPFGIPYLEGTANGLNDWHVKKAKFPETRLEDYSRYYYPGLALSEKNKISFNKDGKLNNFNFRQQVAYHFDATKFGLWLKNNYCIPRGVTVIPQTVESINTNDSGIESLVLTDGSLVTSDLFIDCTGFKSMLLEGALEEPWNDFGDMLPNNSAWATRIPYTDKEVEMQPFTDCTAIENGWVWNIPSWERIGTGYVFSDKYVTPEEALNEFKNHLRSNKMTIPDPNRDVDSFEYRLIKFRTGIHRQTFVKNVVAIGFAAGFIEPLESNGLFTVHEFLDKLVKTLDRETVTQWDRDAYNMTTRKQYIGFAEFVAQHYALSNRTSTKYWKDITERIFQPDVPALTPSVIGDFQDLAEGHVNRKGYDMYGGLQCITTGMNYLPVNKDSVDRTCFWDGVDYYTEMQKYFDEREILMKNWQEEADASPTMYQWLKENIHNDKA